MPYKRLPSPRASGWRQEPANGATDWRRQRISVTFAHYQPREGRLSLPPAASAIVGRMNNTESRWKFLMARTLNLLGVLASLVLIVSISFEAFSNSAFTGDTIYTKIQLGVCLYFLLDFFLLFIIARDRLKFFFKNFVLIILSVPSSYLITRFSLNFSSEVLYLLRFLPIIRGGAALIILVQMVVSNRVSGLFITYLAIFFSITYFETLIFYVFEAGINPLVKSYPDALWWASMTVTTVGSNIIPVTTIGKICTASLAVVGMTTFPIFTAYITTVIHNLNDRQKKKQLAEKQAAYQQATAAARQATTQVTAAAQPQNLSTPPAPAAPQD
ncbi:MAG: potassium channel family protein [Kerstersia gyiorum]|jgi:voltage-gated potassium channel|uniref:potassium channel family protein n=1 Tax=Kerstersia gyiorum TaxID=206506 RepID=UPI00242B8F62|nr:potassium channel family protein [Kerstersia gyiorum]MCH4273128.1 potassium channel family protein [Kerstersia gyiorum]